MNKTKIIGILTTAALLSSCALPVYALTTFSDIDNSFAKDAVAMAVELGLLVGNSDGTFNPGGNAERQAVALVASKFLRVVEAQKNKIQSKINLNHQTPQFLHQSRQKFLRRLRITIVVLMEAEPEQTITYLPDNEIPVVTNRIQDQSGTVGGTRIQIDLRGYFIDPDGDQLLFDVVSSDEEVVTVALDGTDIYITLKAPGTTMVTVRATDGKGGTVSQSFTVAVQPAPVDTTPPVVQELNPSNNAVGVSATNDFAISFDENVALRTEKTIWIKKTIDDSIVASLSTNNQSGVSVSGNKVTIKNPGLGGSTRYYIEIENGAIPDIAGNSFAGIQDKTIWTFTTNANRIQSKAITNFDFSTVYATQANQRSKPMTSADFSGNNAKTFTISDGITTIAITLNWNIPRNGFSIGQVIGSAIESQIQDYYFGHGIQPANWTLNAGSYAADDTFNINTFKTGSNASVMLDGDDWNYFFQDKSFSGSDDDTSKNCLFTISDGTHTAEILLEYQYANMDDLVDDLNYQLTNAQVSATVNKVEASHFELVPGTPGITLTTGGTNANEFF